MGKPQTGYIRKRENKTGSRKAAGQVRKYIKSVMFRRRFFMLQNISERLRTINICLAFDVKRP